MPQLKKYLVSKDLVISEFLLFIRKKLQINQHSALFLIIGDGVIPPNTATFDILYDAYRDMDGYLYMTYSFENTFG
jgi:GABA(A) receptor-associated protein